MTEVVIYARPGCHLCAEAIGEVRRIAAGDVIAIREVNIELDDELHRRHLESIPVIEVDGVERLRLDEFRDGALARLLGPPPETGGGPPPASY